jgi:uncharacterized membrane protein YoaK (UPF0700 family)
MTPPVTHGAAPPASQVGRDGAVMSFIAAFVDSCGFIGLYGVFTAHVTGNFVLIGAALVYPHGENGELLAKMLVLPVFMAAVAVTYLVGRWCERHRAPLAAPGLFCEGVLLFATVGIASAGNGLPDVSAPLTLAAALLLAFAMGVQNALSRLCYPTLPPTTVMTGNVTQIVIDVMALVSTPRGETHATERAQSRGRVNRMLPLIVAFTLGAAAGAGGYAWLGFFSLLVPAFACVALSVRAYLRHV